MSRFDTGNAIGSADPRDRSDNTKNLDLAINSAADRWTDRFGKLRPTIAGAIDPTGLAQSAATSAQSAEAARDAAFVNADVYATVSDGIAATASGDQFQVVEGTEVVRYENSAGTAVEVARYPSSQIISDVISNSTHGRVPISSFEEEVITADLDKNLGYAGGPDVAENHEVRITTLEQAGVGGSLVYRGHIGQGQSNARGAGDPTPSAITDTAEYQSLALMPSGPGMNVALGTGSDGSYGPIDAADYQGFQGLKSEQLSPSNGTTFLEGLGFSQAISELRSGNEKLRLYWTTAEGGVSLAARSPGTDAYSNTLTALDKSVSLASSQGGSYVVESIHSIEGEADTATANFDLALIDVYANQLTADIKASTGQTFDPSIIASQPSSFYGSVEGVLGIYRACRDNPRFNLASAGYHLPYYSDLLHYSPLGHLLMGEYHQKVLETLRRGEYWRPVSPKLIKWDGDRSVRIWLHAPVLPIVLDPNAPNHGDFGFVVRSDAQNMSIESIEVVEPDCIEIVTASAIGANRSVQYAMRGYQSSPRVDGDGPMGALRDSDDTPSKFDGRPLYNWGVHFVEEF